MCFIVSHLGSGSGDLIEILNKNPKCVIQSSNFQYENPLDLNWLFKVGHKCRDSSAIYGDHLLFNISLTSKKFYEFCKFIYVIRPPRSSLNSFVRQANLGAEESSRYYRFRLRRMCEMAKRTPGAVLATWDDLAKGSAFSIIEEYLELKKPLKPEHQHFVAEHNDYIEGKLISQCDDAYERYYYYLSKLPNLKRI